MAHKLGRSRDCGTSEPLRGRLNMRRHTLRTSAKNAKAINPQVDWARITAGLRLGFPGRAVLRHRQGNRPTFWTDRGHSAPRLRNRPHLRTNRSRGAPRLRNRPTFCTVRGDSAPRLRNRPHVRTNRSRGAPRLRNRPTFWTDRGRARPAFATSHICGQTDRTGNPNRAFDRIRGQLGRTHGQGGLPENVLPADASPENARAESSRLRMHGRGLVGARRLASGRPTGGRTSQSGAQRRRAPEKWRGGLGATAPMRKRSYETGTTPTASATSSARAPKATPPASLVPARAPGPSSRGTCRAPGQSSATCRAPRPQTCPRRWRPCGRR